MAQFKMDISQLSGQWPDLCARCAKTGTQLVPVLAQHAKNEIGWHVPLCKDHVRDWELVQYRNRLGMLILGMAMLSVALLTWFLQPLVMANPGRDSRFLATFFFGLLSAAPFGVVLAIWAKSPIRIEEVQGRLATITGVHSQFADKMREFLIPPPLPQLDQDQLFTSKRYRPKSESSREGLTLLFASTIFVSAILGMAAGLFAGPINEATANCDMYSWRYVWLSLAAVALIGLALMRPWYFWLWRFGFVISVVFLVVALILLILMKWVAVPPKYIFALLYGFGPMIVLAFRVLRPIIRVGRVRHPEHAASCSFLGAITYGCTALVVAEFSWDGLYLFIYIAAVASALFLSQQSYDLASWPYCNCCTNWLVWQRIAAFACHSIDMTRLLDDGVILSLTRLKSYRERASLNDCDLSLYFCQRCSKQGTFLIELMECKARGKNNKTTLYTVDRWEFPPLTEA